MLRGLAGSTGANIRIKIKLPTTGTNNYSRSYAANGKKAANIAPELAVFRADDDERSIDRESSRPATQ
ncbi:hypothetical protein I180019D1_21150 [Alistipes sp. i18-0019-D1]